MTSLDLIGSINGGPETLIGIPATSVACHYNRGDVIVIQLINGSTVEISDDQSKDLYRAIMTRAPKHHGLEKFGLTPREQEVIAWVVAGRSSAEIARDLGVSVRTAEGHRQSALSKLGVENSMQALWLVMDGGATEEEAEEIKIIARQLRSRIIGKQDKASA